jgi:exopolysaccharide biosynthesis polyprenyl glycosylphosphotransferase
MGTLAVKIKKVILLLGDLLVLYLSLWLSLYLRSGLNPEYLKPDFASQHFVPFSIIYLIWLLVFFIIGLYDLNIARNNLNFFTTLFKALLINVAIAVTFFYFIPYFGITPKTVLFLNIAVFAALFIIWRQIYNRLLVSGALLDNLMIIGETKETKDLIKYIEANPQMGFRIKRIVSPKDIELIFDMIERIVQDKIQTVVTAIDPHKDVNLVRNLYHCLPLDITLYDLPTFYEKITGKVPISAIEEVWFLENLMREKKSLYETIKRVLDILYAFVLGIVSLPFYPFIALAILLDTPGPVFYKQKRVGENSQIFNVYKFRSMIDAAEKNGAQWAQVNDPRVTKVGKFLRASRLDELPQLYNVIRGDMSFVGPRPERPEFVFGTNLQRQIPFYQIRHLEKPGLTGWAQINFEYGASIEDTVEKLQYDLFYLKNRSFMLDFSIILKTIRIIMGRGGR